MPSLPSHKRVAVYFTRPAFDAYPFDEDEYRLGYEKLGQLLLTRGAQMSIVRSPESYKGGLTFSHAWVFDGQSFTKQERPEPFDLLFLRGRFRLDAGVRTINDPKLDDICTDKVKTYERYRDLSPLTIAVRGREEALAAMTDIPSDLVVFKPRDGSGGEGVVIGSRDEVIQRIADLPGIVQEFIDTSRGVPGITPGSHELRIIFIRGDIVACFLRVPKRGSFLANVSQGGSISELPLTKLPPGVRQFCGVIDATLNQFADRFYSIDIGLDQGKTWKLIELNAQPGLSIQDYEGGEGGKRMFTELAVLLAAG